MASRGGFPQPSARLPITVTMLPINVGAPLKDSPLFGVSQHAATKFNSGAPVNFATVAPQKAPPATVGMLAVDVVGLNALLRREHLWDTPEAGGGLPPTPIEVWETLGISPPVVATSQPPDPSDRTHSGGDNRTTLCVSADCLVRDYWPAGHFLGYMVRRIDVLHPPPALGPQLVPSQSVRIPARQQAAGCTRFPLQVVPWAGNALPTLEDYGYSYLYDGVEFHGLGMFIPFGRRAFAQGISREGALAGAYNTLAEVPVRNVRFEGMRRPIM
jgi:hypothetical protein